MFHSDTKWIWIKKKEEKDEYSEFLGTYHSKGGKILLRIAAETNYIAYVNGSRVAFGQFPNFKNEKYYDEIDISDNSLHTENQLRIVVRYEGKNTSTHIKDNAGVIFEVISTDGIDEQILCQSSQKTLGRLSPEYQQHVCRLITEEVGYSSDMHNCNGEEIPDYSECREVELSHNFLKRPIKKLVEGPLVYGELMCIPEKEIYDLGREYAGYITIDVVCEDECDIIVAYGEHLADGCVRRLIGKRDFSLRFHCKPGKNSFEQLFVRVAGRYVEIFTPNHVKVERVAIIPVMYPIEEKKHFLSGRDEEIYNTSVRTLRLCMHEHYEDCPWREQSYFMMDSRNQMLCGYYAFDSTEFARANIVYASKGIRADGLLEMTFPSVADSTIPFFCIMYPVVVWEYIQHTNDLTILEQVMPAVKTVFEKFKGMLDARPLMNNLPAPYWNFYEWSEGSNGEAVTANELDTCDLILNCAFVYVGKKYKELCEITGEKFEIDFEAVKKTIKNAFYDKEKGMYFLSNKKKLFSQLGNSFAKLIGLDGENLDLAVRGEGGVIPATLSMKCFVYDALLAEKDPIIYKQNSEFILDEIRVNYSYMLDYGATSFWETIKGEADFEGAGSLCHGWAALPIYYFYRLLFNMEAK